MLHLIMISIILIATALLVVVLKQTKASPQQTNKYSYSAKPLLTNNETEMFQKLERTFPEYKILCQVAVNSLIEGRDFASNGTIKQMSVDFVLIDVNLNVIAAIEIDDKSHERADRTKADATKNEAFRQSRIKLIRWKAVPHPNETQMMRDVKG
jgi:hypothetical protein